MYKADQKLSLLPPFGFVVVYKPLGLTSQGLLNRLKAITKVKKWGQAGTLDPRAEGVLPCAFGEATKYLRFLLHQEKVYRAKVKLGLLTDSYDLEGKVICQLSPTALELPTLEEIAEALNQFLGVYHQVPPEFSAIKYQGKPRYAYARQGISIAPPPPKSVFIKSWKALHYVAPDEFEFEVCCSAGTYIRSLAKDLGDRLGIPATLSQLVRLHCGPFQALQALSLERLATEVEEGHWKHWCLPIASALTGCAKLEVDPEKAALLSRGQAVSEPLSDSEDAMAQDLLLIYEKQGSFLGVAKREESWIKPVRWLSPQGREKARFFGSL